MRAEDELTKIYVDLPNHWAGFGSESFWAKPLGDDLYELRNIPFYAYGLNHHDIVRATPDAPEWKPAIKEVVRPSGHRTVRIVFETLKDPEDQEKYLDLLAKLGVDFERSNDVHVTVDIPPNVDLNLVRAQLDSWSGTVGYETCEVRVPGTFTSEPDSVESEEAVASAGDPWWKRILKW